MHSRELIERCLASHKELKSMANILLAILLSSASKDKDASSAHHTCRCGQLAAVAEVAWHVHARHTRPSPGQNSCQRSLHGVLLAALEHSAAASLQLPAWTAALALEGSDKCWAVCGTLATSPHWLHRCHTAGCTPGT